MINAYFLFPLGEKQNLLDVIFVVGSSDLQSFLEYRDSMLATLESQKTTDTKYGVITYTSSPNVFLGLKDFVSEQDLVRRLTNIPWQGPGSDLDGALRKADEMFREDGRVKARKVVVAYGDGPFTASSDELRDTRESLEGKDIKVITVTSTDNEESRDKLDDVTTTDEGTIITDPGKPEESTDQVNERVLTGMMS